jgi:YD repeat-containing protein
LKAIVSLQWVYSEAIIIYDSAYPGQQRCVECSDCTKTSAGLPVDVVTGKMWADAEDLFIDGFLPLNFVRRYNHNLKSINGAFGYGFTHSYNMTVSFSYGTAIFKDWTGKQILFPQKLDGSYGNNKIHQMSFSSITGGYRVTTKDGTKYNFNTSGRLTSIVDRNGNTVTLTYDGSNRLSTVTDPFGRTLTLGYNASNKITSVTDGTRTVTYTKTAHQTFHQ